MRPEIIAVAFDLDGTLYPDYRLNLRLLPFLLKHGRFVAAFGKARNQIRREQELDPEFLRQDFFNYQARLTAVRLNAPPEQVRRNIDAFIYRGFEPHFTKIRLYPHVKELLTELKEKRYKLGLLSDFPPEIKLKNLGIAGFWDAVLGSETVGALKPAPRPFTELASALGCPPENILYVGNSLLYDVAGAQRSGMKTALLAKPLTPRRQTSGTTKADFIFHDYRQLRDFVLQYSHAF